MSFPDLQSQIASGRQERLRLQQELEKAEKSLLARKQEREQLVKSISSSAASPRSTSPQSAPSSSASAFPVADSSFRLRRQDASSPRFSPPRQQQQRQGLNELVEENVMLRKALSSSEEALVNMIGTTSALNNSSMNSNIYNGNSDEIERLKLSLAESNQALKRQQGETEHFKAEAERWREQVRVVREEHRIREETNKKSISMEMNLTWQQEKKRLSDRINVLEQNLEDETRRADKAEESARSSKKSLWDVEKEVIALREQLPIEQNRRIAAEKLSEELGQTFVERETQASERESNLEKKLAKMNGYKMLWDEFRKDVQFLSQQIKVHSFTNAALFSRRLLEASECDDCGHVMVSVVKEMVEIIQGIEKQKEAAQQQAHTAELTLTKLKNNEQTNHHQLLEYEDQVRKLHKELSDRDRVQGELFSSREKLLDEVQQYQRHLSATEAERDAASNLAHSIEQGARDLEDALNSQIRQKELELSSAKNRIAELEQQVISLGKETDTLAQRLENNVESLSHAEGRDRAKEEQLKKMSDRCKTAEERIGVLSERCQSMQKENTELSQRSLDAQKKLAIADSMNNALHKEILDCKNVNNELQRSVNEERRMRGDAEAKVQMMTREMHQLQLIVDRAGVLEQNLESEREKANLLQNEEMRLRQREKHLDNQVQVIKDGLREEETKNAKMTSKIEMLEKEMARKDSESRHAMELLSSQLEYEQQQNANLSQKLNGYLETSKMTMEQKELDERRSRLSLVDEKEKRANLEQQLTQEISYRQMAESRAQEAERKSRDLQQQLSDCRDQVNELTSALSSSRATQRELETSSLVANKEKILAQQGLSILEGRLRDMESKQVDSSALMQSAIRSVGNEAAKRRAFEEKYNALTSDYDQKKLFTTPVHPASTPILSSLSTSSLSTAKATNLRKDWLAERSRLEAAVLRLENSKIQARLRDKTQ